LERLAIAGADADVREDLLGAELDGGDVGGLVGDLLLQVLLILSAGLFREFPLHFVSDERLICGGTGGF
jgi:hypothetical protein